MKRVDIKTGYLCNNNCLFCVQADNKKYKNKDYDIILENLKSGIRSGCEGVVFTGGEFTIRSDCLRLVNEAKKMGYKLIQIQSNGRMFSSVDFCRRIIHAGATEFSPALHGHKREIHDFLTGAESFNQTLQGIKNLKKLGQYIIVNHVIVKPNYRFAKEFAELMVDLKVDQFQYAFVHACGNARLNFENMVPRISLAMPFVRKGLDVAIANNSRVMVEAVPLCFMQGYEEYISEMYIPETRLEEYVRTVEDFKESRVSNMKLKGPQCKECKYFNECEGLWREYPERFGFDELVPVKK